VYAVKSMARPRSFQLHDVAVAALDVIDREGLAALSMRTAADALGMGTMSLYRYVSDRAHLERLVVDLVLSRVDTALPERAPWSKRVLSLCERARAAVAEHPAVIPLVLIHRHTSPHAMRWGEALLGVLDDAGFRGARRVIAFRAVLAYLVGALQVESLGPLAGPGTAALAALPVAEYPRLAETARRARSIAPEREFSLGLQILLRGLAGREK
jgi:AcrR family transcriptional regulator